jgi:cell wall-associated NlpC family hydrolase
MVGDWDAMTTFDPRVTPVRADLAAKDLEGRVAAARFVDKTVREIIDAQAPLRRDPTPDAALDTEALKGERVDVYEDNAEGWSWCQLQTDRYVGWLPTQSLAPAGPAPTHKVLALRTFVFPGPSIKLPPLEMLSLGCRLAIARSHDQLAVTATGGYVPARHLSPIDVREGDFVSVAERFLGTPYLWGGKTSLGLDCSGLVQVALHAAGVACPRDSDMQEAAVGKAITPEPDFSNLKRGDLIFWKGHVGIMRDRDTLLHANAFHMAVAIEPLSEALARIKSVGSEVTSVRRIDQ